jgi:hypothetical protein
LLLGEFFEDTRKAVSSIVHHNIHSLECVYCFLESSIDVSLLGDIKFDSEEILIQLAENIFLCKYKHAFSVAFLKLSDSGFLAVATAMSPLSMTSCTRLFPNPVEVPVIKKTRGMMSDF